MTAARRARSPRAARPRRLADAGQRLLGPRLFVLFGIGCLLFATPTLWPARAGARIAGVPLLYVVLFGAWAAFIAVLGWLVESAAARPAAPERGAAPAEAHDPEERA